MAGKNNQKKTTEEFEVFCYESEEGEICLEFGEAAVSFTKRRFLEFADKLNEVRQTVLHEYLLAQKKNRAMTSGSNSSSRYRI